MGPPDDSSPQISKLNTRSLSRLVMWLLSPNGVADPARTGGIIVALLGLLHLVVRRKDNPIPAEGIEALVEQEIEKVLCWCDEHGISLPGGPQRSEEEAL